METPLTSPQLFRRSGRAAWGLILFGIGDHLTIRAGIGLAPWDVFSMGLSGHLPLTFGTTCILISLLVVAIDLLLKESIGIGTVLDAVLVGLTLDVCAWVDVVPTPSTVWGGLALMTLGMFIMSYSQYLYMSAQLCCGPRDTLMVAIGKRLRKVPIGAVEILILVVVLGIGFCLGGPVGIGTLWSALGIGITMQITFRLISFEPRDMHHVGFWKRRCPETVVS